MAVIYPYSVRIASISIEKRVSASIPERAMREIEETKYDKCPICGSTNLGSANIGDEYYEGYLQCNDCGEVFDGPDPYK